MQRNVMMDEKVMFECRFYCYCLRVTRRLVGTWRNGPTRELVFIYMVSYADKKSGASKSYSRC